MRSNSDIWLLVKCLFTGVVILLHGVNCERVYLHPRLLANAPPSHSIIKYYPMVGKDQNLHPQLYYLLNLPSSHESTFYILDSSGNPVIKENVVPTYSSEIGQLAIPASMLSSYEPSIVYANIFLKNHRVSVCGDGILDLANDEKCEFTISDKSKNSFVAVTPPPNYHFPWRQDKKSIRAIQRDCLWAPGKIGGCRNGAALGGIQKLYLPSPIFTHHCGDGIYDISPTNPLLESLLEAWGCPESEYRQFFTICGYIDEHGLLPIYCNEGKDPWIITGKTIRFTVDSLEQCDLGELLNGAISSGCTTECHLRCSYQHGGRVNWNDWPQLSCLQPCLDNRWKGTYCDIPNCDHGIPNPQEGGCYSCDNEWMGPTCSQNVCGNGRVAEWDNIAVNARKKPIFCICNAGWYGPACDMSYCATWDATGKCLECIPGKRDPATFCIQDACVYGEKAPNPNLEGSCLQPCKVGFFSGKFCNETKCIQWERTDTTSINDIRCMKCLPGHDLPNCTPSKDTKVYSRCRIPWQFGYDCSQSRRKSPTTNQCISGWSGSYCSILACTHGYPNFSHPQLHCIKGSCLPGWDGKWCESTYLIPIDDLSNHKEWARARALTYRHYIYLTQYSSMGHVLKAWKDFATSIVYGKRPTSLMAKNSIDRLPDWKDLDKVQNYDRFYFSESNVWIPLKPDQSVNYALENVKFEMRKFLRILKVKNIYLGASFNQTDNHYEIPIQKKCAYGIPDKSSKYHPCVDCAPGWLGEYCDVTNCAEFSKDHTYCLKCKHGYEGDFCLIKIPKTVEDTECLNGWEGPGCKIPKCLYGYRLVSPQYTKLQEREQDAFPRHSVTVDITQIVKLERKWLKKYTPCGLSNSQMISTPYDMKMHSIVKMLSNFWLCDGIPLRSIDDPRCSACYPGFEGEYCTNVFNEEVSGDCKDICLHGLWDWNRGICFPCFSGFFGEKCEKSYCIELSPSNYTCLSCQILHPSEVNLTLSTLLMRHISPLYGHRFGNYCEHRGLCLFGFQSSTDESCLSCSSPCITGPYCNETRCASFSTDSIPVCTACEDGWKGYCCQENSIQEENRDTPSILDSIFNYCRSVSLVGWPHCQRNRCIYGIVDLADKRFFRCISGSCFPGWGGAWCAFPLWKSEERSLVHQQHLLDQLKSAETHLSVEQQSYQTHRTGLWQGEKLITFSSVSLFTDAAPFDSDPECSFIGLSGHYCNRKSCKNGISSSDDSSTCDACFPGWMGPFCNETHRRNPYDENDIECEPGWWNPILCNKKSSCPSPFGKEDGDGLPSPGGVADLFSENCISCSWPTFFKGPYCNQSTCVHGIPSSLPSSDGVCLLGSCAHGWKGHFCNESSCLHGYRILSGGSLIEHNVYSYFPSQRWSYGWQGLGRVVMKSMPSESKSPPQRPKDQSYNIFLSFFGWNYHEDPLTVNRNHSSTLESKNYFEHELGESPLCTACYPGYPHTPFCDQLHKEYSSPCVHGWFDASTGKCSDCFPGWTGPFCNLTACIEWLTPYVKCKECQLGLHGPLCEYKSHCVHGILDRRSSSGTCQGPCLFRFFVGPFCNETHCLEVGMDGMPKLDSNGYCLKCQEGYYGPYCTSKLICVNGLISFLLSEKTGICISGTCAPGWDGLWCHKRIPFKPDRKMDTNRCENGWIGSLCDIPDCRHGFPDFINGWCLICHPGWIGHACDTKPCLFGIPNMLYHQPITTNDTNLELFSPPCVPGTCLDSWRGPDCAEPSCFGEGADPTLWNAPSGFWYLLFGKPEPQHGWSSTPTFTDSPHDEAIVAQSPHILPSTDGSIPGIDWNTLSCTGCSHPYYRPPKCDRINRCLWGILDEASSDGRCVPGSCQRGGGQFCSKPICYHGVPDPQFSLGCYKCYSGWTGFSSDSQYPLPIEEGVPNVFDLSFDAPPVLVCDTPTCINGWLHFLHLPTVDPHSYICICFAGWEGPNCDQVMIDGSFSRTSPLKNRSGCPEYVCPKPLDAALDCPSLFSSANNSAMIIEIAPRNECPPGTVDSLLVDLFLEGKNTSNKNATQMV